MRAAESRSDGAPHSATLAVLAAYGLGLAAGGALIVRFGFLDFLIREYAGIDFAGFWAAPRMYLNGSDPYDPNVYIAAVAQLGVQGTEWKIFGYPPWVVFLLLPFGALPVGTATAVWTIGGISSAIIGIWMLLRAVAPGSRLTAAVAGALLLGSTPAIITFYSGQWTFFLVGASGAMTALFVAGRHWSPGLFSAVLLMKPHLFVFTAAGLTRAAVARKQAGAVVAAAAVTLVIVGGTILARPAWFWSWLLQLPDRATAGRTVTLGTAFGETFGFGTWVAAAVIVTGVAAALAFDPRGNASLAVWTALSSTAVVYAWSYDHLLLLVPLIVAAGVARETSVRRSRVVLLVGATFLFVGELALYQVAVGRADQSLNAVVPLAVLALVVVALWPIRRSTVVGVAGLGRGAGLA